MVGGANRLRGILDDGDSQLLRDCETGLHLAHLSEQVDGNDRRDAAVAESGVGDRIAFTGFITEDELDNLLRKADVFIYPSLYEGFGIPILEAMKVGTPVVTSNATAMPEVAGDAGVVVDPYDVEAMAR